MIRVRKKYLWNPCYLCDINGLFVWLSRLAFRLPAFDALRASGWQWLQGSMKKARNLAFFVRFVFEKISVSSVISVWHKNMPYSCDKVREFSKKMRESFIEMRKRCFFKPSALRCNHYYDKTCPNLALLAPATETQIVTSDYLAPKLHPSCTHPAPTLEFGCNLGARWVQDGVQDYGG